MEQTPEDTIDIDSLMCARAQLTDPRTRLSWAVVFAQAWLERPSKEDLRRLSATRDVHGIRVMLKAFTDWAGGTAAERRKGISLFTDDEMRTTQQRFRRILEEYLEHQTASIGRFYVELRVITINGRPYLIQDNGALDLPPVDRAVFALGLLLHEHTDPLRVCRAPKYRGNEGETCGRWLVGRPDRIYCSDTCRNRATTRHSRQKKRLKHLPTTA
jgi:hypothetical protein